MAQINKEAQAIIDRIAKAVEKPHLNWEAIERNMREHYRLLGINCPQIVVGKDLVFGFTAARGAAWDAAWGAAWDAARGAARGAAWDAAWGAAWDAAWGAARYAAWGAAWDAARDAAAINTGLKDTATLKFIAIETEVSKALENGLGWFFPMKDRLILVPMPKMLVDDRKRLHSERKPAVSWRGGAKFYFLSGVRFEKVLWGKVISSKISAKEAIGLGNMEQRMAVLKLLGSERLLKELDARLVNKTPSGAYELYLIENVFSQPAYFLKYSCPSTGRIYVSGIDPEVGKLEDAGKAIAWKFDVKEDEFNSLVAES